MTAWLTDDAGLTWLRRTIIVLLLAGFVAMLAKGANRPADPYLRPATPAAPGSTTPATLPGG